MKAKRILLPLDTSRCPLEVFQLVNDFAQTPGALVILLHVINVNILAPENRVYDELGQDAYWHLNRLAHACLHPDLSIETHVRDGNLADEILAEAKEQRVDLMVLPSYGPSFWDRLMALWKPRSSLILSSLVQRIIQEAKCNVQVIGAKTRFNCEEAWGRPGSANKAEGRLPFQEQTPVGKPTEPSWWKSASSLAECETGRLSGVVTQQDHNVGRTSGRVIT